MMYDDFIEQAALEQQAQSMNQRAKKAGIPALITPDDLRNRIYASGGRCEWCARSIVKKPFEVDHIISLSAGGSNQADNLAVACPECNRTKASKHPARFAQEVFARTGTMTQLLSFIFERFQIQPGIQKSFFDDEAPRREDQQAPDPDDPPPYRW